MSFDNFFFMHIMRAAAAVAAPGTLLPDEPKIFQMVSELWCTCIVHGLNAHNYILRIKSTFNLEHIRESVYELQECYNKIEVRTERDRMIPYHMMRADSDGVELGLSVRNH